MVFYNTTKQRRVVDKKDGTKVLQERIVEVYTIESEVGGDMAAWDWEDIYTITLEMQKDPIAVLNCVTGWLSKV